MENRGNFEEDNVEEVPRPNPSQLMSEELATTHTLGKQLRPSYHIYGFSISIMAWIYCAIPQLGVVCGGMASDKAIPRMLRFQYNWSNLDHNNIKGKMYSKLKPGRRENTSVYWKSIETGPFLLEYVLRRSSKIRPTRVGPQMTDGRTSYMPHGPSTSTDHFYGRDFYGPYPSTDGFYGHVDHVLTHTWTMSQRQKFFWKVNDAAEKAAQVAAEKAAELAAEKTQSWFSEYLPHFFDEQESRQNGISPTIGDEIPNTNGDGIPHRKLRTRKIEMGDEISRIFRMRMLARHGIRLHHNVNTLQSHMGVMWSPLPVRCLKKLTPNKLNFREVRRRAASAVLHSPFCPKDRRGEDWKT